MLRLCLIGLVLLLPGMLAAAVEGPDPAAVTETLLREADDQAVERARLDGAWDTERLRLELLLNHLHSRRELTANQVTTTREDLAGLRVRHEALTAADRLAVAEDTVLRQAAERLHAGLDAWSDRLLPGVVPARDGDAVEALAILREGLSRLRGALDNAARIDTAIVVAEIEGARRSVEILRLGAAACWWRSLDGSLAGTATMRDGRLVGVPLSEHTTAAISTAFAIAHRREQPRLLLLPVPPIAKDIE